MMLRMIKNGCCQTASTELAVQRSNERKFASAAVSNGLTGSQEYRDVNRTYNDVAQTLSHYSSLSPRTDVYSASVQNC